MKCLFEAVTVGFEPTGHVFHAIIKIWDLLMSAQEKEES